MSFCETQRCWLIEWFDNIGQSNIRRTLLKENPMSNVSTSQKRRLWEFVNVKTNNIVYQFEGIADVYGTVKSV